MGRLARNVLSCVVLKTIFFNQPRPMCKNVKFSDVDFNIKTAIFTSTILMYEPAELSFQWMIFSNNLHKLFLIN